MNQKSAASLNYKLWSKKILYFYWLLVIISFGGQIVGLIVTYFYFPDYIPEYLVDKMLLPTGALLAVIGASEWMVKVCKIYNPHLLLFSGTLFSLIMILSNPALPGIQLTLLLPMAISLIYLKKKKLFVSFIVNFSGLIIVQIISDEVRYAMSPYEYFAYPFVLCAGFIVYLAVIERGSEVLTVLQQATEKERALIIQNQLMEKLSKTDALTGLYNHKTFHEHLETLVEQGKEAGLPLQLAIIDIDNFKKINDEYGHAVGDAVLKRVGFTIQEKAGEGTIVARYGGEEFAVLFKQRSMIESFRIAEEMKREIAGLNHQEVDGKAVTVSVGLQNFHPNLSKSDFFKQADALLYEAKGSGKNKVVCNS